MIKDPIKEVPADPEAYDQWFRAKVREAMEDTSPSIPHEQVMQEINELLDKRLAKTDKDD